MNESGEDAVLNKVRTSGQNGGGVEEWLDFIFTSKYSIFVFCVSFLQLSLLKRIYYFQRKGALKAWGRRGGGERKKQHSPTMRFSSNVSINSYSANCLVLP